MATEQNLRNFTLEADASIGIFTGPAGVPGSAVPNTGMQYRFVKLVGKRTAGLCTGAVDEVQFGILQNKPQQPGAAATVGYEGQSMIMSGAPCDATDLLVPDATGRAVPGDDGLWQALEPCAAAGVLISAFRVR